MAPRLLLLTRLWFLALLVGVDMFNVDVDPLGAILGYKAQKSSEDMFKNRIAYTVKDAKRAGVHPVFALGASVNSPTVTGGPSPVSGSFTRDPVTKQEKEAHTMSVLESRARIREANASAARNEAEAETLLRQFDGSMAAKINQKANSQLDVHKADVTSGVRPPMAQRAPAKILELPGRDLKVPGHRSDLSELSPHYGDDVEDFVGFQNYLADEVFPYVLGTPGVKGSSGIYRDLGSLLDWIVRGMKDEHDKKVRHKRFQ